MDSDYQIDLDAVERHLRETEVVGFYFPFLGQTMLIDLRSSEADPPMVVVVPMAKSAEDRVRSLKRLRPRFPRPASMMLVPWPKFVDAFERQGVLRLVEERLAQIGGEGLVGRCRDSIRHLREAEKTQVRNAITGEGYETLWERVR